MSKTARLAAPPSSNTSAAAHAVAALLRAPQPPLCWAATPPLQAAWPTRALPSFEREVLEGLGRAQKAIAPTWLYDLRGSELFEQITTLDAYYPSRSETLLLERCAGEIAAVAGRGAVLIELGSGSSRKTELLLRALDAPQAYLPIDISDEILTASVAALTPRFPGLRTLPIVADFTRLDALPELELLGPGRRVVFFPGSTIGNLAPEDAVALLARIGRAAGPEALLVVGADATHDPAALIPAYDDPQGVTAAFNKNLLVRINRELGADFDPGAFRHEARWDGLRQRVEMHLVSVYTQRVTIRGRHVWFRMGESIHTENSYKHSIRRLCRIAAGAGWVAQQLWMDAQSRFAVHVFDRGAQRDRNVSFA